MWLKMMTSLWIGTVSSVLLYAGRILSTNQNDSNAHWEPCYFQLTVLFFLLLFLCCWCSLFLIPCFMSVLHTDLCSQKINTTAWCYFVLLWSVKHSLKFNFIKDVCDTIYFLGLDSWNACTLFTLCIIYMWKFIISSMQLWYINWFFTQFFYNCP